MSRTYHIASLRDFLAIPPDRLDDFLHEFKLTILSAQLLDTMHRDAAISMVGEEIGVDFESMTWKDDDAGNFEVVMTDGKDSLAVNLDLK